MTGNEYTPNSISTSNGLMGRLFTKNKSCLSCGTWQGSISQLCCALEKLLVRSLGNTNLPLSGNSLEMVWLENAELMSLEQNESGERLLLRLDMLLTSRTPTATRSSHGGKSGSK